MTATSDRSLHLFKRDVTSCFSFPARSQPEDFNHDRDLDRARLREHSICVIAEDFCQFAGQSRQRQGRRQATIDSLECASSACLRAAPTGSF